MLIAHAHVPPFTVTPPKGPADLLPHAVWGESVKPRAVSLFLSLSLTHTHTHTDTPVHSEQCWRRKSLLGLEYVFTNTYFIATFALRNITTCGAYRHNNSSIDYGLARTVTKPHVATSFIRDADFLPCRDFVFGRLRLFGPRLLANGEGVLENISVASVAAAGLSLLTARFTWL